MTKETAESRVRRVRRTTKSGKTIDITPNDRKSGGIEKIKQHFYDLVDDIEQDLMAFGNKLERASTPLDKLRYQFTKEIMKK